MRLYSMKTILFQTIRAFFLLRKVVTPLGETPLVLLIFYVGLSHAIEIFWIIVLINTKYGNYEHSISRVSEQAIKEGIHILAFIKNPDDPIEHNEPLSKCAADPIPYLQ